MSDNEELKAEAAAEMAADGSETIHIDEDDIDAANADSKTWTEEIQMAGGEVAGFIKNMAKQSMVRRIIVKNRDGRVLIDIPMLVGAAGLLPPVFIYTVVALGVALLSQCTIVIERAVDDEAAEDSMAEAAG